MTLFCAVAFRREIEAGILAFNITAEIINLMSISDQLGAIGNTDANNLQMMVDNLISDLENLRVSIPSIQSQLVCHTYFSTPHSLFGPRVFFKL